MPSSLARRLLVAAALILPGFCATAATLQFAGYTWTVRDGQGGPGPNAWSADNAWVDEDGLHLRVSYHDGQWRCAEVTTTQPLGFGRYQFQITGRPDQWDRNVVLGLFNYTTPEIGPDGSNEIDIEFAQWGAADNPRRLNWTIYPAVAGLPPLHHAVPIVLTGSATTHRFDWTASGVHFQSLHGYQASGLRNLFAEWSQTPADPQLRIPQRPLPVHLNLWLFRGQPPSDGQPVEVVIRSFSFTPHR